MKLRFIESKPVVGDVISFVFEPEQPVEWAAGQYFHYRLPHQAADDRGEERWFTNSAAPSEGKVVISTRFSDQKGSSFKRALHSLKPGDEIEADGPKGSFVIDDPARNFIFIAGGIGITPFRSMLAEAAHNKQQLSVLLLYANRSNDIPFAQELDGFAAANPHLKIEYIIQPKEINEELLKERLASVSNPLVYISGPEPMVKSFEQTVKGLGVLEEDLKLDDFPGYETI